MTGDDKKKMMKKPGGNSTTPSSTTDGNEKWESTKKSRSFFYPLVQFAKGKQFKTTPAKKTIIEESDEEMSESEAGEGEKSLVVDNSNSSEALRAVIRQEVEAACSSYFARIDKRFKKTQARMEGVFRNSFAKMKMNYVTNTNAIKFNLQAVKHSIQSGASISAVLQWFLSLPQMTWQRLVAFVEALASNMAAALTIPQQAPDEDDDDGGEMGRAAILNV